MGKFRRVFAIGDLQGCLSPLQQLLTQIDFDPSCDQLWFCGDLVNRGPDSLEVLRFVKSLGDAAITVLGNHDLHYLAISAGVTTPRPKDTLAELLAAPDRAELDEWLRHQPLLHIDEDTGFAMAHAGIYPNWTWETTKQLAKEAESVLQSAKAAEFYQSMYGNQPDHWQSALNGHDRTRFIINCFTRMRYCNADHRLDLTHKGPPGSQASGLLPWYKVIGLDTGGLQLVFGHWSTLASDETPSNIHALDTGCVWGGQLTALELRTGKRISIPCTQTLKPEPGA
ncbi:MAG: symmetrical bis(5'-nucleosyl)-tetraphosphatase [Gammaproteobacteria bacterium]|nr:symmetrical bis(5'-nucleosyl)-tetraphosphatase [Gammaproteobacteria bacterium]